MTNDERKAFQKEMRLKSKEGTVLWTPSTQGTFKDPERAKRRFAKNWARRHLANIPSLSSEERELRAILSQEEAELKLAATVA